MITSKDFPRQPEFNGLSSAMLSRRQRSASWEGDARTDQWAGNGKSTAHSRLECGQIAGLDIPTGADQTSRNDTVLFFCWQPVSCPGLGSHQSLVSLFRDNRTSPGPSRLARSAASRTRRCLSSHDAFSPPSNMAAVGALATANFVSHPGQRGRNCV